MSPFSDGHAVSLRCWRADCLQDDETDCHLATNSLIILCFVAIIRVRYVFALEIITPPATINPPPTTTARDGACLKTNQESICAVRKKNRT